MSDADAHKKIEIRLPLLRDSYNAWNADGLEYASAVGYSELQTALPEKDRGVELRPTGKGNLRVYFGGNHAWYRIPGPPDYVNGKELSIDAKLAWVRRANVVIATFGIAALIEVHRVMWCIECGNYIVKDSLHDDFDPFDDQYHDPHTSLLCDHHRELLPA